MNKILLNRLRGTDQLIRVGEDDSIYEVNIYAEKEDVANPDSDGPMLLAYVIAPSAGQILGISIGGVVRKTGISGHLY